MEAKNFVKDLLASWRESLLLYKDTKFWLIVLKTIKETYSAFFKQFWWLIILYFITEFILGQIWLKPMEASGFLVGLSIAKLVITSLVFFLLFLTLRASLDRKDKHYYSHHLSYFPIFFITLLLFWAVWYVLPLFIAGAPIIQGNYYYLILKSIVHFSTILFSPFLLFYVFFYFDSHLSTRYIFLRLGSAFKMLVYTYPFCLIQTLLISLIVSLLLGIVHLVLTLIKSESSVVSVFESLVTYGPLLVAPIFLGIFYPLYTKQVHNHYDRYAV
jgi:hypothetical protein